MNTNLKEIGIFGVISLIAIYITTPVLNMWYSGIFLILLVSALFVYMYKLLFNNGEEIKLSKPFLVIMSIGIIGGLILPFLTSSSIFRADDYHKVLENKTKVVESNFNSDVSPVDINKIRVVDQALAKKLGEKILGENAGLGSVAELGEFTIQSVKGELYWVAPLLHSGFFKWLNSDGGTPGYVKVSATNSNDIQLITDKGNIKYQPNAYFGQSIKRFVWLNGFMTVGITDISFEINDEGKPFWVITKFDKTVGYLGKDVIGTVIVDPESGKISEYDIDSTPEWVDRVQPEEFITTQLDDYGVFSKGWINAVFTKEGIIKTTKGMSLVFGDNGKSYWYTGMQSVGKDGSTVGFVLVDTRTKKTTMYKISGAAENKAKASAEGIVQEKGYEGTNPILYNVLGTPTYILTLKDKEGLVKNISMVSVKNYGTVGIGIDIKSALRNYKSKLLSQGNNVNISDSVDLKELNSVIERINADIKNGNSYYYLKVKGSDKIFMLDSSLSEEIVLTNKDDNITIKFEDTEGKFISISHFHNSSI